MTWTEIGIQTGSYSNTINADGLGGELADGNGNVIKFYTGHLNTSDTGTWNTL